MSDNAVEVHDVSKRFRLYRDRNQSLKATVLRGGRAKYDEFWALKNVSFNIPQGGTYGLIGENGSGKSTMLKCIANILTPDSGSIIRRGRMAAMLELGSGFHPELSGRENIYLNGSILGLTRKEIDDAFDSIVDFSGIEQFIDQPVKNYSSGMYVRLGFSIAIHIEPEILLVDEVLAVGDAAFQRKCMEKFNQFHRDGRTVVLVSHATGTVKDMCDRVAWLQHGQLLAEGSASEVVDRYITDTTLDRMDAPENATPGATHYGDGAIKIVGTQVLNAAGEETTKVLTGEPIRIRLTYQTSEPVTDPVFGVAVHTVEGIHAWSHHSREQLHLGTLDGQGTIDVVVPKLALNPGVFDIWVNVGDQSRTRDYHLVKNIKRFDVAPSDAAEGDGLMVMGAHYERMD